MRYQLKQIHCRPWTLAGLSLKLIESHYENNYGGALRRLNAITAQLEALDPSSAPPAVYNALKREELVALNSTLLHELYFACLGGDGQASGALVEALARDFGSFDRWRTEFIAMGNGLAGGSGWVVLTYVPRDRRLINQYASDHAQGIPGGVPILALDMYEHAYHMDFGANAEAYVEAFMGHLGWTTVYERYQGAVHAASEPFGASHDEVGDAMLLDVRRAGMFEQAASVLPGARWRDPDRVEEWIGELSPEQPVAVYCAYGFHVGCNVTRVLRERGFDARFIRGGVSAWYAAGGARAMRPATE
jgi:Fe-Mn family superoxide dismutase